MSATTWNGSISGNYGTSGNWSNGVPTTGSDVYFTNDPVSGSVSVTAGLDQHTVVLNSFNVDMSYSGTFGTTAPTYLYISSPTINIGIPSISGQGNGSGQLNIQVATSGDIVNVYGSNNQAASGNGSAIRLLGSASFILNVFSGNVGVALSPGETSTVSSFLQQGQASTTTLGIGTTVTTINLQAGTLNDYSANSHTTVGVYGGGNNNGSGRYNYRGTGGMTTLNLATQLFHGGSGTIGTMNVTGGGTADFSSSNIGMTITTNNMYKGSTLNDPNRRLTLTNPINYILCRLTDISINRGFTSTVTV